MSGVNELIDSMKREIAAEESKKASRQAEFRNIASQKVTEQFVKTVLEGIKESLRNREYTQVGGKKRIEFFAGCDRLENINERVLLPERALGKRVFKLPDIKIDGYVLLTPFGRVRKEVIRTQDTNFWGKPKPDSYRFVGIECSLSEETIRAFGRIEEALNQKGISCSLGMLGCCYERGNDEFVEATSHLFRSNHAHEGFPVIKVWCDFD